MLSSNESIKAAAIVFQTKPCLILSGVSVQTALDPVLACLLQLTWHEIPPQILRLPGQQQQLLHWGESCAHPLWSSPPLLAWGAASTRREVKQVCCFSVQRSPPSWDHWGEFYVFWGVNFQILFLVILHLNVHFYFFHCNTKGFLSCFSRYLILC